MIVVTGLLALIAATAVTRAIVAPNRDSTHSLSDSLMIRSPVQDQRTAQEPVLAEPSGISHRPGPRPAAGSGPAARARSA